MNSKLVESLTEAIIALPKDDYDLFQNILVAKMIQKTPGVCGGYACIRDTRIPVWTIISLLQQGATDQELLIDFEGLTDLDLLIGRKYYQIHQEEIDTVILSHAQEKDWDV
jgi:uncharacterized protein (DUF433 family)